MATISNAAAAANGPGDNVNSSGAARGLAMATLIMMVTVLASRLLGVLRDAIISHYFGRGVETDAYNAAFTIPDLLFYLLQSGALSSTIVPIITEYRHQGDHKAADHTVSIVASTIFVVIGLLICIMWIFAKTLTVWLNPGFTAATVDLAVPLTRILLPAQIFFFMGGLMMGVLYSRKQFLVPAMGPVIYNTGIICGGLFLHRWLGVHGLVWGAVAGALIGNFMLPLIYVLKLGVVLRPNFAVTHPAAIKVWKMLLPMGLGVALPNIDQIVNKMFASWLGTHHPGATTAMMNAYRLMLLPIGIFAQAMALAIYPTMSSHAAEKNIPALRSTMNASLRNILFLTVPASVLMFVLASPIITLLLEGGRYHHADTLVTAGVLRMLSIGIFAWSAQSLLTRGFYALQNSRIPVASGAVVSVIFVFMNWFVVFRTHFGVDALGLTTTIAATIHAVALLIWLRMRLKGIDGAVLFGSVVKTVAATVVLTAVTLASRHVLNTELPATLAHHHPKLFALAVLAPAGLLGIGAYLATARVLHMAELRDAIALIRRKSPATPIMPPSEE